MSSIPQLDRLKSQLLTSGIQQTNQPLFQVISQLIDFLRTTADIAAAGGTSGGSGGGGGVVNASFITQLPEAGFPSSRQLRAGAGINVQYTPGGIVTIHTALPFNMGEGGEGGDDGAPGPPGVAGAQGPVGPSSTSMFYAFDSEDGVDGLPGLPGAQGFTGSQGPIGSQGIPGQPGNDGNDGVDSYLPGPTGPTGIQGIQGLIGAQGLQGFDGEDGLDSLLPGPTGPAGDIILTDFTQDLGVSNYSGTFDITGLTGLPTGANVLVVQTKQAITSKGSATDEPEMDQIDLTGVVLNSTTIRVSWQAPSIVVGTYAFCYGISRAGTQSSGFYSTGTWTPTLVSSGGGTPTYTTQTGAYTKIGRLVTANFFITLATLGTLAAGNLTVGGLPFTASADNGVPQDAVFSALVTTWVQVYVVVNPSTATALIRGNKVAAVNNVTNLAFADLSGTTTIAGGLIYTT